MVKVRAFLAAAGLLIAGSAVGADFGVYGTAGTVGIGGGLATNFGNHVGVRLGYTTYSYDVEDFEESDLTFNGKAEFGGAQALLDIYPFGGSFRISAGALESAYANVRTTPVGGTFTFDGTVYTVDDVGEARGTADFGSMAPYVGVGFGRALSRDGHFAFTADLGVAFTGAPEVSLNVTCNAPDATLCNQLATHVAAEEADLQEEADEYEYWPVVSFGLSYKF